MADIAFAVNQSVRQRLLTLLHSVLPGEAEAVQERGLFRVECACGVSASPSGPVRVVVTANEVNDRHGTGPLVKRACKGWQNVLAIRARNDWGGVQEFGDWQACIPQNENTRAKAVYNILRVLRGRKVETVLCVPFLQDEFLTSIAIRQAFDANLGVYLMDDQNIASRIIPDSLMREFLEAASLRLATHPELRFAYEEKYGLPFHILPAIVPDHLISTRVVMPTVTTTRRRKGALIGSFWDQVWFDGLCSALQRCDCELDWFGNNKSPWLQFPEEALSRAGIVARGIVPEDQLALELEKYPFVLVPVSAMDGNESNTGVACLSLPGRILFTAAAARAPVLIVGSERTCGARFVKYFGIGEVAPYEAGSLCAAMDRLSDPEVQEQVRRRAAQLAPRLSDTGVGEWLAQSIALHRPADNRFEDLFAGYDAVIDVRTAWAHCSV
jgi:hypothetical protein